MALNQHDSESGLTSNPELRAEYHESGLMAASYKVGRVAAGGMKSEDIKSLIAGQHLVQSEMAASGQGTLIDFAGAADDEFTLKNPRRWNAPLLAISDQILKGEEADMKKMFPVLWRLIKSGAAPQLAEASYILLYARDFMNADSGDVRRKKEVWTALNVLSDVLTAAISKMTSAGGREDAEAVQWIGNLQTNVASDMRKLQLELKMRPGEQHQGIVYEKGPIPLNI